MRKVMVWAVALALVWLGVQETPVFAEEEALGQADVVIKVGLTEITDPNKGTMPVPQVPFDVRFGVEVEWVDPADNLSIELSGFRLITFDLESDPFWTWEKEVSLQLKDEGGKSVDKVVFESNGSATTTRWISLERSSPGGVTGHPELIMFKQTVRQGETELFIIDPPWAGKPPTG